VVLSGLTAEVTYYFVVRAADTSGNERVDSNEVNITMPVPPTDTIAPSGSLLHPSPGTPVRRKGTLTIEATARDNVGVSLVQILAFLEKRRNYAKLGIISLMPSAGLCQVCCSWIAVSV
jgi:hypothetical protein